MCVRILLIVALLSVCNLSVQATPADAGNLQASYKMLTVEDGLPSSKVNCLIQDAIGYTWLGTDAGLSRYDGKNITNFSTTDGLPNNRITDLYLDSKGILWILSRGSLCAWQNGNFLAVRGGSESAQEGIISICEDQQSNLWVTTRDGIFTVDIEEMLLRAVEIGFNWKNPRLQLASGNDVWVFNETNEAVELVSVNQQSLQRYPLPEGSFQVERRNLNRGPHLLEIEPGEFIYNTASGLHLLGKNGPPLISATALNMETAALSCLKKDAQGRIWLSDGERGMLCLERETGSNQLSPIYKISAGNINDFYQDKFENYWFATDDQGVGYISFNASAVRNLQSEDGLPDNRVVSLCAEGDQNIWLGLRDGQVSKINYTGIGGIKSPRLPVNLGSISSMLTLEDGSVLVAAQDGLSLYSIGKWQQLPHFPGARAIAQAANGRILLGTDETIFEFSTKDLNRWANTASSGNVSLGDSLGDYLLTANQANDLIAEADGSCWFGNDKGLFHFTGAGVAYFGNEIEALSASVTAMERIDTEWLAIGTLGSGLVLYNTSSGAHFQLTREDGLASNFCTDLHFSATEAQLQSQTQALWVATNRGLTKLTELKLGNQPSFEYITYNAGDGLLSDEINAITVVREVAYIATNRGLSIFNESDFSSIAYPPQIYINKIWIADNDTSLLPEYKLPFARNSLRFNYTGISYKDREGLQYRYRLRGLSDNWSSTQVDELNFSSLQPGKYTFEVKAVNPAGLESKEAASVAFTILAPIYQRWWFLVLMAWIFAAIAFAIYKLIRTREERRDLRESVGMKTLQLDHKIRELKRSNEELAQFAYIASHDLKEPLRNIANYIQLIQQRYSASLDADGKAYMDIAVNGVKRMYAMIGGLLSYSGLVNQDTSVSKVELGSLVDGLVQSIRRNPETENVRIDYDNLPDLIGNEEQIRLLFLNLIDNGLKFNEASERLIEVDCLENDWEYHFTLRDNGIGLDEHYADKVFLIFERLESEAAREGSGIGLALCKKIVERHGGRIWYRSNEQGTTFHFTIKKDLQNQLEVLEQ